MPKLRVRLTDPRKVKRYGVSARIHEGAAVVSGERELSFRAPVRAAEIESVCVSALDALKQCVLERDGIVGHIKAFCVSGNESVALSTTGGAVQSRASSGWQNHAASAYTVSIAAIAFTNIAALEARLIDGLDSLGNAGTPSPLDTSCMSPTATIRCCQTLQEG